MTDEEPRPATATVSAVNLKLPPFWPTDPEVWFAQVEAQFATRGITAQKTRFDYIVSTLSPEIATEVRDLILKPPTERPYDTLKTQLIKRTAASEQRKLQQLINAEELGDRKPTQLLRRMQQLLGDQVGLTDGDGSFLRELFLQRLPSNVRMVLASTDKTLTLDKLAELADKVMEVATPTVAAIATPTVAAIKAPPDQISHLREEVARLTELVQSLATTARHCSVSRSRSRRSPSPAAARHAADPTLCWYHQNFGDLAQKCKGPCARGLNGQANH